MKFKASVRDPKTLAAVCSSQRTFQKKCLLKLHPSRVRFITNTGFHDGTQVWVSCKTDAIFTDIVLQSAREDTIWLELCDVSQLIQGMRGADRCCNVTLRLARIDTKNILKLSMQALMTQHDISQDIHVRVLTETEIRDVQAPPLEDQLLVMILPPIHELTVFVEKVRNAGCTSITFDASVVKQSQNELNDAAFDAAAGRRSDVAAATSAAPIHLTLSCDTIHASFVASYRNVEQCMWKPPTAASDDPLPPIQKASVTVDVKKFWKFLSVRAMCPQKIVLHIVDDRSLVLTVHAVGDTSMVFYIPGQLQR